MSDHERDSQTVEPIFGHPPWTNQLWWLCSSEYGFAVGDSCAKSAFAFAITLQQPSEDAENESLHRERKKEYPYWRPAKRPRLPQPRRDALPILQINGKVLGD